MSIWNDLRFFCPDEFDHPDAMDPVFLSRLDEAREDAGIAFIVTSDFRPPDSQIGVEMSAHKMGLAVDLRCSKSWERWRIVTALIRTGFRRIGIYDRHIHVDAATEADGFPTPRMWWGESD